MGEQVFYQAFTEFVRASGRWRDCEPDVLLEDWATFVDACVHGYSHDSVDYFDNLTTRSSIEKALQSPDLARFPEMDEFRREVSEVDQRLRTILRFDVFPQFPEREWWCRGIVRYAGPRLVRELWEAFRLEIDQV